MKAFIKNMVCPRCIIVVRQILSDIDIESKDILLGEVELQQKPSDETLHLLGIKLREVGLELLQEPNQLLVESIKKLIIEKVQSGIIEPHFILSSYLKKRTFRDYSTLTKVFSEIGGCTIEKFYILQKLEKAKEMLLYGDMAINSIARKLGYSSSQHFSSQFKKVYNQSPKNFKLLGATARKSIDNVIN